MNPFALTPGSVGIRFGAGAINQLPEVLVGLKKNKVLIITDPGVAGAGVLAQVEAILKSAGIQNTS
ncbi:MAG: iron-containing alcohol dehydrogenase, partial [Actinobacteria bacterium]|nr:iron-containing alcohol dehydrogenase [Actinomycetota bacterium]